MQSEWSLPAVHDVVAATVPDRTMVICGDARRSFAEVQARTRGLAAFLVERGIGIRSERDAIERWESGQDAVALVMHNGAEYVEAMLGAYRARAVPFNVNQHYRPAEVGALLSGLGARVVVHHRRYGPLLGEACDLDASVLIDVDDGSGVDPLPGSTPFEVAVAASGTDELPTPSPDDLYVVCTGGTTGTPKAVLWRQADIYRSGMGGSPDATAESIAAAARANPGDPWYAVSPMMHAAAQWTAYSGLHGGAPVLLHDDSGRFDARTVLRSAEAERAHMMSIVGDAYARPIIDELRAGEYDLSNLALLGTGGAVTSETAKAELLELLPHVLLVDGYGSSETGGMAFGARTAAGGGATFQLREGATVVDETMTRELAPGEDEIGWTARRGAVPLGYLGDRVVTEATFPIIAGERMSIPGDRARWCADGTIELLGRDAMVVNTGGEKVFVEEVERTLHDHPDVHDVLVVGRSSDRFGQEVVAVVAPRDGARLDPGALREFVAGRIARFKAPRAVLICTEVRRHANGKADYRWAEDVASAAVDATASAN